MEVLVLLKKVPDTGIPLKVAPDGADIDRTGITYVMSPYDEYALEAALRLKEGGKVSGISVLTLGDAGAEEILRTALAKGADRAFRIHAENFELLDGWATARAIHAWLKDQNFSLVLAGKEAVDDASSQVPFYLATFLDVPAVSYAVDLDVDGERAIVERETDRGEEKLALPLPAVVAFDRARFEPRLPNLRGIMQAKRKPIETINVDIPEPTVKRTGLETPPPRQAGRVTTSDFPQNVEELIQFLEEKGLI